MSFHADPSSSGLLLQCPISSRPHQGCQPKAWVCCGALAIRAVPQMETSRPFHAEPGTPSECPGWSRHRSPSFRFHGRKQLFNSCTSQSPHGIALGTPTSSGARSGRTTTVQSPSQPCALPPDAVQGCQCSAAPCSGPRACYATMHRQSPAQAPGLAARCLRSGAWLGQRTELVRSRQCRDQGTCSALLLLLCSPSCKAALLGNCVTA